MNNLSNLALMTWLSPAFPVGSFAYSHGLEWAYEIGEVKSREDMEGWLIALVDFGSLHQDRVLLSLCLQALAAGDAARVQEVADLAVAFSPSSERLLESCQQGQAFCIAIEASWPQEAFSTAYDSIDGLVAYPIAYAMAVHAHAIPRDLALAAYGLGFINILVSAAVRLGIVGQTDGQKVIARFRAAVESQAALYLEASEDNLGSSCFRSDMASLHHETQYSRLFRS